MSLAHRKQCLRELKEIGYQTGCGFMVGSPGQTLDTLYEDLVFIKELQPEMVGIGPFIPHQDTPFVRRKGRNAGRYLTASGNHPADSSDGTVTIHHCTRNNPSDGKRKGYSGRSNVVMPNLSPIQVRDKYQLYDNKICTGERSGRVPRLSGTAHSCDWLSVCDRSRRQCNVPMKNKKEILIGRIAEICLRDPNGNHEDPAA